MIHHFLWFLLTPCHSPAAPFMFHSLDSNIVPAWGVCAPLLQSSLLYKWTLLLLWLLAPPPAGRQQCDIHGHCCRWDLWKGHFPLHDLRGSSIAIKMRREPLTLATAPSSEEELPRVRPLQNRTEHYAELKSSACRHSMAQRRNMGQITRWFGGSEDFISCARTGT